MKKLLLMTIVCLTLSTYVMIKGSANVETYENGHLLISVEELANRLTDPNLIIIDTRQEGYEKGHIPGAISFDTKKLVDPTHPVEGYLVREKPFEELMRTLGVNLESEIVIYDGGADTAATRLFYALELYGHPNEGSWQEWGNDTDTPITNPSN